MAKNEFVEVAKVHEISDGKMKHIELEGKEVLLANIDGKFYAMSDRCGHMNALLSMGKEILLHVLSMVQVLMLPLERSSRNLS